MTVYIVNTCTYNLCVVQAYYNYIATLLYSICTYQYMYACVVQTTCYRNCQLFILFSFH